MAQLTNPRDPNGMGSVFGANQDDVPFFLQSGLMQAPPPAELPQNNNVLDALTRMSRGQSNFGSLGSFPAAAYRIGRNAVEHFNEKPPFDWGAFGSPSADRTDPMRERQVDATVPLALGAMGGGTAFAPRGSLGMAGGRLTQPASQQGIRAYHGSPFDFERFDASKMGTGEGAQAYGAGHYFGEHPDIAAYYRGVHGLNEQQTAHRFVMDYADGNIADAVRKAEAMTSSRSVQKFLPILQEWKNAGGIPEIKPPGHAYEVNINARPEQFLDWDKPLAGQPVAEKVFPLLEASPGNRVWAENVKSGINPAQGRTVYNVLADKPQQASAALRDAGIPGIKYLDQGSRDAGGGSSNYVVFPGMEHIIQIMRKYGMAGLAALGGAQAGGNPSQAQAAPPQ